MQKVCGIAQTSNTSTPAPEQQEASSTQQQQPPLPAEARPPKQKNKRAVSVCAMCPKSISRPHQFTLRVKSKCGWKIKHETSLPAESYVILCDVCQWWWCRSGAGSSRRASWRSMSTPTSALCSGTPSRPTSWQSALPTMMSTCMICDDLLSRRLSSKVLPLHILYPSDWLLYLCERFTPPERSDAQTHHRP